MARKKNKDTSLTMWEGFKQFALAHIPLEAANEGWHDLAMKHSKDAGKKAQEEKRSHPNTEITGEKYLSKDYTEKLINASTNAFVDFFLKNNKRSLTRDMFERLQLRRAFVEGQRIVNKDIDSIKSADVVSKVSEDIEAEIERDAKAIGVYTNRFELTRSKKFSKETLKKFYRGEIPESIDITKPKKAFSKSLKTFVDAEKYKTNSDLSSLRKAAQEYLSAVKIQQELIALREECRAKEPKAGFESHIVKALKAVHYSEKEAAKKGFDVKKKAQQFVNFFKHYMGEDDLKAEYKSEKEKLDSKIESLGGKALQILKGKSLSSATKFLNVMHERMNFMQAVHAQATDLSDHTTDIDSAISIQLDSAIEKVANQKRGLFSRLFFKDQAKEYGQKVFITGSKALESKVSFLKLQIKGKLKKTIEKGDVTVKDLKGVNVLAKKLQEAQRSLNEVLRLERLYQAQQRGQKVRITKKEMKLLGTYSKVLKAKMNKQNEEAGKRAFEAQKRTQRRKEFRAELNLLKRELGQDPVLLGIIKADLTKNVDINTKEKIKEKLRSILYRYVRSKKLPNLSKKNYEKTAGWKGAKAKMVSEAGVAMQSKDLTKLRELAGELYKYGQHKIRRKGARKTAEEKYNLKKLGDNLRLSVGRKSVLGHEEKIAVARKKSDAKKLRDAAKKSDLNAVMQKARVNIKKDIDSAREDLAARMKRAKEAALEKFVLNEMKASDAKIEALKKEGRIDQSRIDEAKKRSKNLQTELVQGLNDIDEFDRLFEKFGPKISDAREKYIDGDNNAFKALKKEINKIAAASRISEDVVGSIMGSVKKRDAISKMIPELSKEIRESHLSAGDQQKLGGAVVALKALLKDSHVKNSELDKKIREVKDEIRKAKEQTGRNLTKNIAALDARKAEIETLENLSDSQKREYKEKLDGILHSKREGLLANSGNAQSKFTTGINNLVREAAGANDLEKYKAKQRTAIDKLGMSKEAKDPYLSKLDKISLGVHVSDKGSNEALVKSAVKKQKEAMDALLNRARDADKKAVEQQRQAEKENIAKREDMKQKILLAVAKSKDRLGKDPNAIKSIIPQKDRNNVDNLAMLEGQLLNSLNGNLSQGEKMLTEHDLADVRKALEAAQGKGKHGSKFKKKGGHKSHVQNLKRQGKGGPGINGK